MHEYTHIHTRTHAFACTSSRIKTYANYAYYECTYIHLYVRKIHKHTYIHQNTPKKGERRSQPHIHTYVRPRTHTHVHTNTDTYTGTHTCDLSHTFQRIIKQTPLIFRHNSVFRNRRIRRRPGRGDKITEEEKQQIENEGEEEEEEITGRSNLGSHFVSRTSSSSLIFVSARRLRF